MPLSATLVVMAIPIGSASPITAARVACATAMLMAFGISGGKASEEFCEPAVLVFDSSGSMKGTRIDQARAAARTVVPELAERRRLGLVTYGGRDRTESAMPDRCGNIQLRLRPQPAAGDTIIELIEGLVPGGSTPLSEAVAAAVGVLRQEAAGGVIVLVTDGEENCGGDPCALGREIAVENARIRIHVVGYRLRISAGDALACLARQTKGTYSEVTDTRGLAAALQETLGCTPVSGIANSRRFASMRSMSDR